MSKKHIFNPNDYLFDLQLIIKNVILYKNNFHNICNKRPCFSANFNFYNLPTLKVVIDDSITSKQEALNKTKLIANKGKSLKFVDNYDNVSQCLKQPAYLSLCLDDQQPVAFKKIIGFKNIYFRNQNAPYNGNKSAWVVAEVDEGGFLVTFHGENVGRVTYLSRLLCYGRVKQMHVSEEIEQRTFWKSKLYGGNSESTRKTKNIFNGFAETSKEQHLLGSPKKRLFRNKNDDEIVATKVKPIFNKGRIRKGNRRKASQCPVLAEVLMELLELIKTGREKHRDDDDEDTEDNVETDDDAEDNDTASINANEESVCRLSNKNATFTIEKIPKSNKGAKFEKGSDKEDSFGDEKFMSKSGRIRNPGGRESLGGPLKAADGGYRSEEKTQFELNKEVTKSQVGERKTDNLNKLTSRIVANSSNGQGDEEMTSLKKGYFLEDSARHKGDHRRKERGEDKGSKGSIEATRLEAKCAPPHDGKDNSSAYEGVDGSVSKETGVALVSSNETTLGKFIGSISAVDDAKKKNDEEKGKKEKEKDVNKNVNADNDDGKTDDDADADDDDDDNEELDGLIEVLKVEDAVSSGERLGNATQQSTGDSGGVATQETFLAGEVPGLRCIVDKYSDEEDEADEDEKEDWNERNESEKSSNQIKATVNERNEEREVSKVGVDGDEEYENDFEDETHESGAGEDKSDKWDAESIESDYSLERRESMIKKTISESSRSGSGSSNGSSSSSSSSSSSRSYMVTTASSSGGSGRQSKSVHKSENDDNEKRSNKNSREGYKSGEVVRDGSAYSVGLGSKVEANCSLSSAVEDRVRRKHDEKGGGSNDDGEDHMGKSNKKVCKDGEALSEEKECVMKMDEERGGGKAINHKGNVFQKDKSTEGTRSEEDLKNTDDYKLLENISLFESTLLDQTPSYELKSALRSDFNNTMYDIGSFNDGGSTALAVNNIGASTNTLLGALHDHKQKTIFRLDHNGTLASTVAGGLGNKGVVFDGDQEYPNDFGDDFENGFEEDSETSHGGGVADDEEE